jgi:hypothetical protein
MILILLGLSMGSLNAAVVKSFDDAKECTRYSLKHPQKGEKLHFEEGESLHLKGTIYGFSFENLSINFDERSASFETKIRKFGLNKSLGKVVMHADHERFNEALNRVNKSVATMDEVCINRKGELVDFVLP